MFDSITAIISLVIISFWVLQWILHVTAIVYGLRVFHRKVNVQSKPADTLSSSPSSTLSSSLLSSSPSSLSSVYLGVSVLKPLLGVDSNLEQNLETFFLQDYPKFELLFCFESSCDAGIVLVKKLMSKYPNVDARLFTRAVKTVTNPKINNMNQGYKEAKYPLVLISDSNIRMYKDTLSQMVATMDNKTSLVHQMPYICDKAAFSRVVEKVYFGARIAKMYLVSDIFRINCISGMSVLFRKSIIDEEGGLEPLGIYLSEDYHIARILLNNGWRSRLCNVPAQQNAGETSLVIYLRRMKRWTQLRNSLVPVLKFLDVLSECFVVGSMAAWSMDVLFAWNPLAFFFVHVLAWFMLDYLLVVVVQGSRLSFTKRDFMVAWLFREITTFYVLLASYISGTVEWRSRKFQIKNIGSIADELPYRDSLV